jgi:hypothetical protein
VEEPTIDDDPYDYTPPPGPSPREVRRRWAEEGNVEALLDLIRTKAWSLISVDEQLKNVMRACQVRAKSDPEGFSRELFAQMVGFNGFLLLRTQLFVTERVAGRGESPCTPTLADFTPDVVERLLPRLLELQRAVAEILAAQAQVARLWALTRAKEARDDRGGAADGEANRRGAQNGANASRSGPPPARARAKGSRDGVVPLPVGGRRRG